MKYEVQLVANKFCKLNFKVDIPIVVRGVKNELAYPKLFTLHSILRPGLNRIKVDCSATPACSDEAFATGTGLIIDISQNGIEDFSYVTGYSRSNYSLANNVIYGVGILVIMVSLFDTFLNIIVFTKVLKQTKLK